MNTTNREYDFVVMPGSHKRNFTLDPKRWSTAVLETPGAIEITGEPGDQGEGLLPLRISATEGGGKVPFASPCSSQAMLKRHINVQIYEEVLAELS